MRRDVKNSIAYIVGSPALKTATMGGGCIGDVYRVELASGETVVAKVGDVGSGLDLEGFMLSYLAENSELPVPDVLHTSAELLLMSYLPGGGGMCQPSSRARPRSSSWSGSVRERRMYPSGPKADPGTVATLASLIRSLEKSTEVSQPISRMALETFG